MRAAINRNLWIKLFRIFGGAFLFAIGLVVATTLLILMQPRIVLNEPVLRFAASLLSKEGTAITWTSVEIRTESLALLHKRLSLDFTGLCIRESTRTAYDGCFDRAQVTAAGGLVRFIPRMTEAGPVVLSHGKVALDLGLWDQVEKSRPKKPEKAKKKAPFRIENLVPGFLRQAQVFPIDIEIADFRIIDKEDKEKQIRGTLHLSEQVAHPQDPIAPVQIELTGHAVSSAQHYDLSLGLSNDHHFWAWNHWSVKGRAKALLSDQRTVDLSLNASPRFVAVPTTAKRKWSLKKPQAEESIALCFDFEGKTTRRSQTIRASVNGSYVPGKLDAKIEGAARNLIPELPKLSLQQCGISIERVGAGPDSRYRTDCQVSGTIPIPPERLRFLEIPTEAGVRVQADLLSSDFIPSDTTQLQGDVDVVATPILTPLFEGKGEIHGKLSGVAGEFPRLGQVDSRVAIELRIPDFQKLSKKLSRTAWGIPAPFQALEGDITFRAAGSSNLEQGILPLRLRTKLDSASQNMDLDAGGTIEISDLRTAPTTQLNFAVTLSDLKILLPRLKLERPPRILPEDRIHPLGQVKKQKAPQEESSFGYRAVIRTPPGKPVQIVTNLAKAPIPVNLDLNMSSDTPPVGKIDIGSFPVEAFRRKATVQHFDIDLVPKAGDSGIDGRVDVPLGDYKTHIELVGSIDKPQVKISSDPPIGEDQLLAALLFNRTPEELDPSESAAVGSTRATVSQGALSLASLFLLASTPIEALTYNPDTGQVTAQVRLSEGLSLNLGSGENQAGAVGLRKRIGSNFFVTTDVNNIIQNSSTVSAYLEWRKRY
jgi:hypothetical protein